MLRIQLINKNMRLMGVTEEMIGKYVIADDWKVIDVIGECWEGIGYSMKMKAIRVDYINKTMETYWDMKEEGFKNIIINEKYNPNVGNHWGAELLVRLVANDNVVNNYSWFLCTTVTRELIKRLHEKLGQMMFVSSELVDAGRFSFYTPIVGIKPTALQANIDSKQDLDI